MRFWPVAYISNIYGTIPSGKPWWQVAATFFRTAIIHYPSGADLAYRWTSQRGKNEPTIFDPVYCLTICSRASKWQPRANIRVSHGERSQESEDTPRDHNNTVRGSSSFSVRRTQRGSTFGLRSSCGQFAIGPFNFIYLPSRAGRRDIMELT